MELRWLETFLAIVDTRSFTAAAERLHLSQPAVTRQMGALERHFGVVLLERRTRRVIPTAAGAVVEEHARRILGAVAATGRAVADLRSGHAGRLALGASSTVATYFLPPLLARYRQLHPRHELAVHTGLSGAMVTRIAEGALDLGLVMDFAGHAELAELPLGRYEMVAIAPRGHRLAGQRRIDAADLAREPLISMAPGTNLRRFTDALFAQPPRLVMEVDNVEAMKRMVEAGLGLAVVPAVAVRQEKVAVMPLRQSRRWSAVYRRAAGLTPPMRAFLDLLTSSSEWPSRDARPARRRKDSPPPARPRVRPK